MTTTWRDAALCVERDSRFWFPDNKLSLDPIPKKDERVFFDVGRYVCDICPVKSECSAYGREQDNLTKPWFYGMWGGQHPEDRKKGRETQRPRKVISEADVMLIVPKEGRDFDVNEIKANLLAVAQPRSKKTT